MRMRHHWSMRGQLERDRRTIEIVRALGVFALLLVVGWLVLWGVSFLGADDVASSFEKVVPVVAGAATVVFLYQRR